MICLNYYTLGGNAFSYKVLLNTHAYDKFSAMAAFLLSITLELLIFQEKTLPSILGNKKTIHISHTMRNSVFLCFVISPRKRGCQTPASNHSIYSGRLMNVAASTD